MPQYIKFPILLVNLLLLFGFSVQAQGPRTDVSGQVVAVHDGDTIAVLDNAKKKWEIRLVGIDAPELAQPFGDKAKRNLSRMIIGKAVTVELHKTESQGLTVGKVLLGGRDAGLQMVADGYAWHYKEFQHEQTVRERQLYSTMEFVARKEKLNIWSEADPVPPWEFRRQKSNDQFRHNNLP